MCNDHETLPAGIVAEQLERGGGLRVGNLEIHVRADVFASGAGRMEKLRAAGLVEAPVTYATNDLALLVRAGNPKGVRGLADLARADLRLSLPDPKTEGIGRQIAQALERAGGPALREAVLGRKVREGTTTPTRIHHRQTPLAILDGAADAGVVWSTEARFQRRIGHPLEAIAIPPRQNATGSYQAAVVRGAPHPAAAQAFLELLRSDEGQAIYRSFGFAPPG